MGDAYSTEKQNVQVNKCLTDHRFDANNSARIEVTKENSVDVQILGPKVTDSSAREIGKIVEPVEVRIKSFILAAMHTITPRIDTVRARNASSGWDVASLTGTSERGEQVGFIVFFQKVSLDFQTSHVLNITDETQAYNPNEVRFFGPK